MGVTSRTLRHYEDEGLLSPERQGLARIYSQRDRARLTLILRGRRVGFSLAEIKEILDLYQSDSSNIPQLQYAKKKFAERINALERQSRDIEESIAELKLSLNMIDAQLEEANPPPQPRVRMMGYGVMPAED